jgi:hypothetical protein
MRTMLSLAAFLGTVAFSAGEAQAQIYVSGGVHVGVGVPVIPAPPIVVYEPYYYPPPPPVILVPAPPPPPVVVVRPAPVPAPLPVAIVAEPEFQSEFGIGARAGAGITGSESASGMGGGGAFVRFHSFPNFAVELSVDGFAGEGYAGAMREEVPVELSVLWFFGRHDQPFRLFLLTGVGAAWARVGDDEKVDEPWYVGGLGGIGVEWRLLPSLALEADLRGFVRQRVNDRPDDPEYAMNPLWNDGNCNDAGECTDLQGGGAFHLGAIFYF